MQYNSILQYIWLKRAPRIKVNFEWQPPSGQLDIQQAVDGAHHQESEPWQIWGGSAAGRCKQIGFVTSCICLPFLYRSLISQPRYHNFDPRSSWLSPTTQLCSKMFPQTTAGDHPSHLLASTLLIQWRFSTSITITFLPRFLKANQLEVFMAGIFRIAHIEFGITEHVFVLINSQVKDIIS